MAPAPESGTTRTLILAAALRRFADQGFAATSLTEIADDVGIKRPSLLHHFPSKEALYREVLVAELADWTSLVNVAVVGGSGGWEQAERVLVAAFEYFEKHPEFVRLTRREAIDGGPMLSAELGAVLRPMFDRAVEFLEREMDAGRLRRYDAAQLLLTGYGAVLSYLSDAPFIGDLIGHDPLSPDALAARRRHVLDLLRAALDPELDRR
ncbi:MAG: TetR/AcrR family transcriptional regulator [Actinomycetes bacterium]